MNCHRFCCCPHILSSALLLLLIAVSVAPLLSHTSSPIAITTPLVVQQKDETVARVQDTVLLRCRVAGTGSLSNRTTLCTAENTSGVKMDANRDRLELLLEQDSAQHQHFRCEENPNLTPIVRWRFSDGLDGDIPFEEGKSVKIPNVFSDDGEYIYKCVSDMRDGSPSFPSNKVQRTLLMNAPPVVHVSIDDESDNSATLACKVLHRSDRVTVHWNCSWHRIATIYSPRDTHQEREFDSVAGDDDGAHKRRYYTVSAKRDNHYVLNTKLTIRSSTKDHAICKCTAHNEHGTGVANKFFIIEPAEESFSSLLFVALYVAMLTSPFLFILGLYVHEKCGSRMFSIHYPSPGWRPTTNHHQGTTMMVRREERTNSGTTVVRTTPSAPPITVEGNNCCTAAIEMDEMPTVQNKNLDAFRKASAIRLKQICECSICFAPIEIGTFVRPLPICEHIFHNGCIEKWLRMEKNTCPNCRKVIICCPAPPSKNDFGRPQSTSSAN